MILKYSHRQRNCLIIQVLGYCYERFKPILNHYNHWTDEPDYIPILNAIAWWFKTYGTDVGDLKSRRSERDYKSS